MKRIVIMFTLILGFTSLYAQLDSVIVEKYYISDAHDAEDVQYITNENGDVIDTVILEAGTVTYRVYIQLDTGYVLSKVYGDANHPMKISSTENFFNNIDRGQSFGTAIQNTWITKTPTLALDTWLTLGQATNTKFGVLKTEDTDGTILGAISGGYLTNNNPDAGFPLTSRDGLAAMSTGPIGLTQYGIKNEKSGIDSTIFGEAKAGTQFICNNAYIEYGPGVMGADRNSIKVLVAQLTTKGDISFKLNVQIHKNSHAENPISFVADTAPGDYKNGIIRSKYLTYPQESVCGCNKPIYLEYKPGRDCDDSTLCKTKLVFGCMDPQACNYDQNANFNVPSLCCYPGQCADRDISLVCPDLSNRMQAGMTFYPNPVKDQLNVNITSKNDNEAKIEIYNFFGRLEKVQNANLVKGVNSSQIDVSHLESGIYLVRYSTGNQADSKTFIKVAN